MNREQLIAQKNTVRQQIERISRQLQSAREQSVAGDRADEISQVRSKGFLYRSLHVLTSLRQAEKGHGHQQRIRRLEQKMEELMAEEYRLRTQIDRCQR